MLLVAWTKGAFRGLRGRKGAIFQYVIRTVGLRGGRIPDHVRSWRGREFFAQETDSRAGADDAGLFRVDPEADLFQFPDRESQGLLGPCPAVGKEEKVVGETDKGDVFFFQGPVEPVQG